MPLAPCTVDWSSRSWRFLQQNLDPPDNLQDAVFFFEDGSHQLLRQPVDQVIFRLWVLAIEVAVCGQQFFRRDSPGPVVLLPFVPPGQAGLEFLVLEGLGLGVVLPAFRQGVLVIPDLFCRSGAVEEEQVRRNTRIGCKYTVRQADNGVEAEFFEEFLLDTDADAVSEQGAVGNDDGGPGGSTCRCGAAVQFPHDQLQEQERRFGGLLVVGEISLDALLLLAAKERFILQTPVIGDG